jgi:NAD(P)-dependent dehydrogenase (short-subunit alcohol dehydrogenase family)
MNMNLSGKSAIVTGASRGIGRAIVQALADEGARVAALARTSADLEETVRSAEGRGGKVVARVCDVTDERQVEEAVAFVIEEFGSLDVLVNNAGQRQDFSRVDELSLEDWRWLIDANLTSVFLMSRAAARRMLHAGSGSIVNVASIAGPVAFARIGAYCAAKSGVIALTKVMAAEWAEEGIRVNAVAPGWIESPMNVELRTDPNNRDALASITSRAPMKRFGAPGDVASAVLFLAGSTGGYVTGETLFVDGGWVAI